MCYFQEPALVPVRRAVDELGDLLSEIFDADKPVMKLVMLVELSKCLYSILEIHTASEGVCFSPFNTF